MGFTHWSSHRAKTGRGILFFTHRSREVLLTRTARDRSGTRDDRFHPVARALRPDQGNEFSSPKRNWLIVNGRKEERESSEIGSGEMFL